MTSTASQNAVMVRTPPDYFARIHGEASALWDKLETGPVLAGPWWQLFSQVQSPRHVLSELLQNADDAEDTTALVLLDKDNRPLSLRGSEIVKMVQGEALKLFPAKYRLRKPTLP